MAKVFGSAAGSVHTGDEDATKAELQRRMEEARESITQTVTEIKDTGTNQYQSIRETAADQLNLSERFRERPGAWLLGAFLVGFVLGYNFAGRPGFKDER